MTEKERLIRLFENLYAGSPWIDVTILGTVAKIQARQAAKRVENCNTIWEILVHLIAWRENVLKRLQGEIITTPANNYIFTVEDTSGPAWEKTLQALEHSQEKWVNFLQEYDIEKLNSPYPPNQLTHYEHIQGILQHDAYHLGQIVLLLKLTSKD